MICFPNTRIDIYRLVDSGEVDSEFHQPLMTETLVESVVVDFQPVHESDNSQAYGTGVTNTYKIFCELGTDIQMGDMVVVKEESFKYTVIGQPLVFRNLLPHMEVLVQMQD